MVMNATFSRYEIFVMYTSATTVGVVPKQTYSPATFVVVVVVFFFFCLFILENIGSLRIPFSHFQRSTRVFKALNGCLIVCGQKGLPTLCILQRFTPLHRRLLYQHHGRHHKILLQILSHLPVSHQGPPVLPYFPST